MNNAFLNNLTDTQHTCLQYGSKAGKVLSKIPLVGQKIGELADKVLGSHPEGKCDNPDGFVVSTARCASSRLLLPGCRFLPTAVGLAAPAAAPTSS
ncbi:hypothetical protein HaLaN_05601 [Haematococcus lacustris]|uniref:Uncharacterized protein n=1 Tax=Haematococcus lacustris TaxID=44745 RepID=A0A699YJP0_HAELA|nr:hypothetical protein HaLaN_05601 [Haematococcus lacustris]